ncbi:MAG: hypothetical protein CL693_16995 [Cellvibrionaceae bacterium]|nr:hypothetical protein [Cellvibrionaceae bacterium]
MILFNAKGKVQKDRSIMRETDARMAKYSRRGLIVNFLAYLLCLSIGYLTVMAPTTAVVLTVGLIVTTIVRAGFLFRFESMYDCGPARWRTLFFISTLVGAVWWSTILVTFTLTLGMVGETPLLWLYTIIFFSTTIHVTSPFKAFSRIYLAITLLPAVIAACFIGGFDGYMYAVMMLVFVVMLYHQVEVLEDGYWQRLEAINTLKQKARALEVEKRDVDASVDLNAQFLNDLGHEFRTSLNDVLGGLSLLNESQLEGTQQGMLNIAQQAAERQLDLVSNIVDFSKINNRQLVLEHNVFNLRSQLEQWIEDLSVDAHQQGVELDYAINKSVPLRAYGDVSRIGHIFKNLSTNAVQFSDTANVHIEIDFRRESDRSGILEILLIDRHSAESASNTLRQNTTDNANARDAADRAAGLWLTICKGLSECMGGSVDIDCISGQDTQYRLRLPITSRGHQDSAIKVNPKLQGKQILLVQPELPLGEHHIEEMQEWGLRLAIQNSFEGAIDELKKRASSDEQFSLVIVNLDRELESAKAFSDQLLAQTKSLADLPQLLLLRHNHRNCAELVNHIDSHERVFSQYRPLIAQKLHDFISHLVLGKPLAPKDDKNNDAIVPKTQKVLLVEDHRVNQMVAEGMLKKLGYPVMIANNGVEALSHFKKGEYSVILMDCQMPEMDGFEATRQIRKLEQERDDGNHIPIIAMTAHVNDDDQSLCFTSGMDDYLAKPVRYDVLESHLQRWLGTDDDDTQGIITTQNA